jgi:hypothetical protein
LKPWANTRDAPCFRCGSILFVHTSDVFVRQQNHHHVGGGNGLVHFGNFEASLGDLVPRCAALAQTDHNLDAAVVQVLRVCVALAAVANDGNGLALDQTQVAILVVKNFHSQIS